MNKTNLQITEELLNGCSIELKFKQEHDEEFNKICSEVGI